jgi:hypothetical protein
MQELIRSDECGAKTAFENVIAAIE